MGVYIVSVHSGKKELDTQIDFRPNKALVGRSFSEEKGCDRDTITLKELSITIKIKLDWSV